MMLNGTFSKIPNLLFCKVGQLGRKWAELDWEEIARYSSCDTFGLPTYLPKLEQGKRLQHLMRYSVEYGSIFMIYNSAFQS
ncbi:hypothetical protein TNCT_496591 [Trichonephila clavata]|uniref:Uncharacterized protein n=1 Tax=Trichonephila clavata TaxID=2740835 RepID=A0A8X6GLE0_TRICU|nr:hypothetical protein TNCT_496591 [Trichonephila clavata]